MVDRGNFVFPMAPVTATAAMMPPSAVDLSKSSAPYLSKPTISGFRVWAFP